MLPRPNRVNNFIKRVVLRTLIRRFDKSTISCVGVLGLLLWSSLPARPQDVGGEGKQSQQETKDEVESAWDELLRDVIPEAVADPALVVEQVPVEKGAAADFADHFFFETSTHYIRQETTFSGRPTVTGVINVERGEVANPDGIPFPPAFQPNSDHVYSFMNWGTRGWLSPHVNTNFSLRYRQDLTSVLEGSPSLGVINTFRPNRLFELLSGFVEIGQLGSTGALARSSLQVGRQFVYGAELAALDGASFSTHQRHYSLTLFGGRRFSYFSNPDQRAIGGSNIAFRLPGDAGLEYRGLFYVKGTHNVIFRKRFEPNWVFRTDFKMVGGSPVDFGAQVMYLPTDGKSTVRLSFFQKLSDKDFFYDYTLIARDRDPFNRLSRLNLGPLSPYSQVAVHARREILPRLRVGGSVWMRRLNDPEGDQAAFLASFEDYRFNVQTYPLARLETFLEFHQRNTDRPSPFGITEFDDVSRAGETRVRDLSGELRRPFGDGRLVLRGGAFYRRINLQNRFFFIENERVFGVLGGFTLKIDQRTKIYFDYSLDDDYFLFRPSVQRAHLLRVGLHWRY